MSGWRTDPARAGWALALGGGCVGVICAALAWRGGASAGGLAGWLLLGGLLGAFGLVAVGGPGWWLAGRLGGARRGPVAAGVTGGVVAALAALLALGTGDVLIGASAVAAAVIAGFLGALVALAMWLVAYRAD